MKLDRRWWMAIGVAVVAVVALVYSVVRQPPEECGPVQELLEFNRSQSALIYSETGEDAGLPSAADDAAYRAWADGLADRAQKVTAPANLAWTGAEVANLANEFVGKLPRLRAETQSRAPGAPTPPVVYEMAALNAQITEKLDLLSEACSG